MAELSLKASRTRSVDVRRIWSLVLMAASGFAGLGYQIVWTQQGALWLGHESAAVLAVVAAFFGGLALGALAFGTRIERSARPGRWYAACEAVVASWGLVLLVLMAPFSAGMLGLTGVQPTAAWQWTVAFVGMFVVLLPATAAMGATLPAIERVMSRMATTDRSIAPFYAANTLGATAGVLGAAFWLVPAIGLSGTALVCIALNVFCAAGAWMLAGDDASAAPAPAPTPATARRRLPVLLACTGLLGIGYEVLVVRVLSQVCEDTVYTFALLLAIYLVGSAGGAMLHQRGFARRGARADADPATTDRLLSMLASACLLGAVSLWFAETMREVLIDRLGAGMFVALGAEGALALIAFALPTCVMGALFSHLAAAANGAGIPFGRSLGINIVGAASAPLLFGVVIAPLLGAKASLLLVVAGYLALIGRRHWTRPFVWVSAGIAGVIAIGSPPLVFIDVPDGGHVVSYREGVLAAVSVVEDGDGVARLRIDNRQQEGSSATRFVDARQALLPLLLHPAPHRALFLGLGTGVTAASAAQQQGLEVDAVELLPEVIASSPRFTSEIAGQPDPRLHLLQADARRYVRTARTRYDLIVADNFHPARSGSGSLYTIEHFEAVRERLADDGLFCQWLPLHQLDLGTLRVIVQSFRAVYPRGWAMLASNSLGTPVVGLVGNRDGRRFDLAAVGERVARSGLPQAPAVFGIDDPYALLGSFIAGPAALQRFAGDAQQNTDDRPLVAYRAPSVTYAPQSTPQGRLMQLLDEVSISPSELIDGPGVDTVGPRLAAYWLARDRYLAVGQNVRLSADVDRMLAQVRQPLLAIVALSADFRPAYDPLLGMALALSRSDGAGARALLTELVTARPERPEARQVLDRMRGSGD